MRSVTLEVVIVVGDRFNSTTLADEIHEMINDSGLVLVVDSVKVTKEGAIDSAR